MKHPSVPALLTLSCLASCSGSSGGSSTPTGVDNPTQAYVVQKMGVAFAGVSRTLLLVPFVLLPSARAAAGITFELDTIGAVPHTYDFSIPLDSNGDGTIDTTIAGAAVFSADPEAVENLVAGFEGAVDVLVTTANGTFDGQLELGFDGAGFAVSGTATYDDTATGASVELTVDAASPLQVAVASDAPGEEANACMWSVDGDIDVAASNADGDYTALWEFLDTSALVLVTGALFTPPAGVPAPRPDSRFEVAPCPGTGSFDDWEGSFQFDWFCVPFDDGDSIFTITQVDADTIEIDDEGLIYFAERDAHDPHAVHGSFQDTDGGGTYVEHFTWVMANDGQSFQQASQYFYLSGPGTGSFGYCDGTATRN